MEDWYVKVPEEEQKRRKLEAEEKAFRAKLPLVFKEVLSVCLVVFLLYTVGMFVVKAAAVEGEPYNLQKLIGYVFKTKSVAGIAYVLLFFVDALLLCAACVVSAKAGKNIGRYISVKNNSVICYLYDLALLISFVQLIICSKTFGFVSGGGMSATVLTALLTVATIVLNAVAEKVKRKFNKYGKDKEQDKK